MEEALELARSKDEDERMEGVVLLNEVLDPSSSMSLSFSEVTSLVDCCLDLLKKDENFWIRQDALQALDSAALLSGGHFMVHIDALVPAIVDCLGDVEKLIRDAARRLLLTLMEVSTPIIIVERAGPFAWTCKNWRVREQFAQTVTSAIDLFPLTNFPFQWNILPPILKLLSDPSHAVREQAFLCIEAMYAEAGSQFRDELQRHKLPSSLVKTINIRLKVIRPKYLSSGGVSVGDVAGEINASDVNLDKGSPKAESSSRETSLFGGELIYEENATDLKSWGLEATEKLFKRPREGRAYLVDLADEEIIKERLNFISLSKPPPEDSIDEALEIADASFLLRLMGKSNHKIDLAGQKAKRGAHLMQLARVMLKNGEELLQKSKDIMQKRYNSHTVEMPPIGSLPGPLDRPFKDYEEKI